MISFQGFSKRFGSVAAVDSLTFDVAAGEVVALLGPNGSGKTTSIRAAAGLIHPSAGVVTIGKPGRPAVDPGARELSSFLPQRVAFPDALTGREVIDFYCRLRGRSPDRAREVLRMTGLNGSSNRAVGTYSGGMAQRLGLAVAMLPESPVLLLDEPTAALDPDGLSAFYELIDTRRRMGHTVLFSSHQLGDVERLADRLAVLVDGRLVATLTSKEMSNRLADCRGRMDVFYRELVKGRGHE